MQVGAIAVAAGASRRMGGQDKLWLPLGDLLLEAYAAAGPARSGCTDDTMLLEHLGLPVATFPGDPRNIKVSTPPDLPLVTLYVHERYRRPRLDTASPPCHDVTGELSS
jgi:2-C-methyl-D-erythritol 4-phosphate cytidylyltransferase